MTKHAWYLGHSPNDVGECAILVGDPDRVDRIATRLSHPVFLPVKRGLKTVTGHYNGVRVSIAAFGRGSPIATIVLHELAYLGLKRFVRIGTAMHFPPARPGEFLISQDALSFEGTAGAYNRDGGKLTANEELVARLNTAAIRHGVTAHTGLFASFDAFYRDMFAIDDASQGRVSMMRQMLHEKGVLATDMETSALIAAAGDLGVASATLCLGTVDGISQAKLGSDRLATGEARMFQIALDAIADKG